MLVHGLLVTSSRKCRSDVKFREGIAFSCRSTSPSSVVNPPLFSTASASSCFSIRSSYGIPLASSKPFNCWMLKISDQQGIEMNIYTDNFNIYTLVQVDQQAAMVASEILARIAIHKNGCKQIAKIHIVEAMLL